MSKEKMKVGVDLIRQLSTAFYPNINSVFSELVSNASDAFATEVRIEIAQNTAKPNIVIEDNGQGMNHEELVKFFYISSTKKKEEERIKKVGGLKREIIGKFGIGKLSMYRICKKFEITSWKNGEESTASMDFDKFEKNSFIEDFDLEVDSEKTKTKKTGTLIRLLNLKQEIDVRLVKRALTKFMPLKPDFNVYINGVKLEPAKRNGSTQDLDEELSGVGKVTGQIVITDKSIGEESKIYIRVFGRVVNESGEIPIKRLNLTHGLRYINRLYVDLNVNGLDEAVLTNRAGFIEDNPKFITFLDWLKKKLNNFIREVDEAQQKEEENTAEVIPQVLSTETTNIVENKEVKERLEEIEKTSGDFDTKIEKRVKKESYLVEEQSKPKEVEKKNSLCVQMDTLEEQLSEFKIGKRKLSIKVSSLGKDKPESALTKDGSKIIINKDNPLYKKAEKISFDALKLHCLKAIIVDLALTMAGDDIKVFKETYDLLTRQDSEIK
jgi:hypothetical protein